MKASNEFLKKIFDIFWQHPKHFITLGDIEEKGIDLQSEEFRFHINLLMRGSFVEYYSENGWMYSEDNTGKLHRVNTGARLVLTNEGHDFAEALNSSDVWEVVKNDVKDMSYGNFSKLVKAYIEGWMKKKAQKYLDGYQSDNDSDSG